jgi:hypothetical protein
VGFQLKSDSTAGTAGQGALLAYFNLGTIQTNTSAMANLRFFTEVRGNPDFLLLK